MEGKSSIIQGLPLMSVVLALLFFIILRVVARFKRQALGDSSSPSLPQMQFDFSDGKQQPERIQLKRPAFIEKADGVMKVGLKELTTGGAFVTCPRPFPIGESFALKVLLTDREPHIFQAEVVWNNQNVIEEEIVARGMKVRFLRLSENDRKTIDEVISLRLAAESLP